MGNAVGKIIDEIVGLFKRNYKRPKLWITVILLFFLLVLFFPYIDSNFFYFSRIEKRIGILERIMELDQEVINSNPAYLNEYQNILQEMEQQSERSINSLTNKLINSINYVLALGKEEGNGLIKGITGAIWLILITICVPFMNTFKKRSDKIIAFFILLFMSVIAGLLFSFIPVIVSPMVNYVGFPILQFIFVIFWAVKNNAKKKT